ncbi:MAG: hypothetical protein E4G95_03650, partial [Bacteroidia bacterium]
MKMKLLSIIFPLALLISCRSSVMPQMEIIAGEIDTTLFSEPFGMCSDNEGNLYIADAGHNQVKKVTPDGIVTVFAGTGVAGYNDGAAESATFNYPSGICSDREGNFFVAGFGGQNIRKISRDGTVTTIAGTGEEGYRDGTGSEALFSSPRGICIDSHGNLYVGDCWNHRIRKISPDGIVSTFAGGGRRGELVVNDWRDGKDTSARFDAPCGMAIDTGDNIYVADANNNCIRKISPDGTVTTLAGIAGRRESRDGIYGMSVLNCPTELVVSGTGIIYFSDTYGNQVKRISREMEVKTVAGTGVPGRANLEPLNSMLASPRGITIAG